MYQFLKAGNWTPALADSDPQALIPGRRKRTYLRTELM